MSHINNPTLNYLLQKRNKIIWYETFKQLEIWGIVKLTVIHANGTVYELCCLMNLVRL